MIYPFVLEMKKLLGQMSTWLDKAAAHATARKFDVNTLFHARLAPDQFALMRQIQSTCDLAKFAASRTSGKDSPSHADTEQTVEEIKQRIASVISYLETFTAADFDAAGTLSVSLPRWEGKSMAAPDYFVQHAIPNFFFHLTTVYALLRHNGVDVGKRDFLGQIDMR